MRTLQCFSHCLLGFLKKNLLSVNLQNFVHLEPFDLGSAFDILNCVCGLPVGTVQNSLQFLAMCLSHILNKVKVVGSMLLLNPLNPELNPICYLLALLGAHHFLHVSRIRVKLLTFRLLISYIWSTHS